MPRGGALTVETRSVEIDGHAMLTPGKYVALAVRDNGSGMDEETRAHLFEPFFTTKAPGQGTGLGMATVYAIAKQSGGGIEVSSEPGKGTTVTVYLPRFDLPATPEIAPAASETGGWETILLVENEDAVRNLMGNVLRREGYRILDAPNAAEANRAAGTHARPIHLLIMEAVMLEKGGRELAAILALGFAGIKLLFTSGYADQAAVRGAVITGEAGFIQKPFTPAALLAKVRELLGVNGTASRTAGR